jgi:hypothetical protein
MKKQRTHTRNVQLLMESWAQTKPDAPETVALIAAVDADTEERRLIASTHGRNDHEARLITFLKDVADVLEKHDGTFYADYSRLGCDVWMKDVCLDATIGELNPENLRHLAKCGLKFEFAEDL